SSQPPWETLETHEIQKRGLWAGVPGKRGSRARFQLPDVEAAVEYSQRDLPIDPYFLGVWLGNGSADIPRIAFAAEDRAYIEECIVAYSTRREWTQPETGVGYVVLGDGGRGAPNPLRGLLAASGLLNNKHVPEAYLRSSVEQRQRLLAGLVD